YWARGAYRTVGRELRLGSAADDRGWTYELHREKGKATLVAEVPGPEEELRVRSNGNIIEVRGGGGFTKKVKLPFPVREWDYSYRNGVLQVVAKRRG
ncbi:MAG: Hsp20/alpha crystallin family protein, partial [Candidatus Geothermarchaeales archaeon]